MASQEISRCVALASANSLLYDPYLHCFSAEFWRQLHISRILPMFDAEGSNTLDVCDEELALALVYVQEISSRRNAVLPCNRLPSEILATIFGHLCPTVKIHIGEDPAHDHVLVGEIISAIRCIIAVTHVCQHWRSVALETAPLWTTLWLGNEPWTREMLLRAKGTPLNIYQTSRWSNRSTYPAYAYTYEAMLPVNQSTSTAVTALPVLTFSLLPPSYSDPGSHDIFLWRFFPLAMLYS